MPHVFGAFFEGHLDAEAFLAKASHDRLPATRVSHHHRLDVGKPESLSPEIVIPKNSLSGIGMAHLCQSIQAGMRTIFHRKMTSPHLFLAFSRSASRRGSAAWVNSASGKAVCSAAVPPLPLRLRLDSESESSSPSMLTGCSSVASMLSTSECVARRDAHRTGNMMYDMQACKRLACSRMATTAVGVPASVLCRRSV